MQTSQDKSPRMTGCASFAFIALCLLFPVRGWGAGSSSSGPKGAQDSQVTVKVDPTVFDEYVGQYQIAQMGDLIISVSREGDKFYFQGSGAPKLEIFPKSPTVFSPSVMPAQLEFVRDGAGRISSLIWHQNGNDFAGRKITDQPLVEITVPFVKTEVMVPTRDGKRLHTLIFSPEKMTGPLPIIFNRTPYGIDHWSSESVNARFKDLVAEGYVFAFQDIRGRFGSDGQFVMQRPPRDPKDQKGVDESTDTYDSIEWLVKNVPRNNGRIGMVGISYDGWLTSVSLLDTHPALKAVSPQAPMTDTYVGDDFFHNGAFRLTYGYEYVTMMESSRTQTDVELNAPDAYDWYLSLGPLSNITRKYARGKLPTWKQFVAHPSYDSFWQKRAAQKYLSRPAVPTLVVGGWWDQEDLFGPLATYKALEANDSSHRNFLVEGPWNHGGWAHGSGDKLGDVNFGVPSAAYFRKEVEAPWFAFYLKDKGELKEPEALVFQSGTNRWMRYESWPPREGVETRKLYLRGNHRLSFDESAEKDTPEFESYVSDPAQPVPYRKRPVEATYDPKGSGWYTWLVQDQRFLQGRGDVVSWRTEALTEDVTITGDIVAHLYAATSGTDSDWVVKLIDVYPETYPSEPKMAGYELMVAAEILRGRYRQSLERPAAIAADRVNEYVIDLRGNDYCFRKGHRMMVQVQSSWFPLYDRNPQKYVKNIFDAKAADFRKATQRIYQSASHPSHLTIPVVRNH